MATKQLRNEPQKRLLSLDVLRGFDMFWIIGGGSLAIMISRLTGINWLEIQMHHAEWVGFHFEDLIFPLFMFISGVAIPLSVKAKLEKNVPKRKMFWKVLKRMVILIFLGILYNGVFKDGFENGRIASVLGQIGIAYFFASLIIIYSKSFKIQLAWLVGILVAFGILQLLIPVPGFGSGVLTPEGSFNGFIDRLFLPGRLYGGTYDPEGIVSSLSATVLTLFGTVAGNILRKQKTTDWQKIGYLAATGAGLILLALLISPFYPIIKKCWTSSFNMLAGGISFLLMALFYLIIDHWKISKWGFYFRVIGMNSIFIYLLNRIVDGEEITEFFLGWLAKPLGESGELLLLIGGLGIFWSLLYYMYKKKIFLRV